MIAAYKRKECEVETEGEDWLVWPPAIICRG